MPAPAPAPAPATPARLLVLDLDGTLVDSIPDLLDAANRMLDARGLAPIDRPAIRRMIGDGVPALVERALRFRGAEADDAAISAFSADYAAHAADRSALFPGIAALLDGAKREGWRLAVCTNKPVAAANRLLEALGIAAQLDAVGGGDSFPVRKPDPGHLLGTVALAHGRPDRAVLLGDHRNDVASGQAAGIPVVFAAWGYGEADSDAGVGVPVAAHPSDVLGLAAALLSTPAQTVPL